MIGSFPQQEDLKVLVVHNVIPLLAYITRMQWTQVVSLATWMTALH